MSNRLMERIENGNPAGAINVSVGIIDALQNFKSEDGAPGLALAFILLCEKEKIPVRRLLQTAENMLNDLRFRDKNSAEAVRMFLKHEVK